MTSVSEANSSWAPAGLAPLITNRLWDASHVNTTQVIAASSSGDKQSFQIAQYERAVRLPYHRPRRACRHP
jgi:hypothetical protein